MVTESEKFVTMSEVRELLEKEQAKRELTNEQKLALQHAQDFSRATGPSAKKIVKDLKKIEKLSDQAIYKLADFLPTHPDDVRVILSKERYTLEKGEIDEIISIIKSHSE